MLVPSSCSRSFAFLACAAAASSHATAQCLRWEPHFGLTGMNQSVRALAVLDDGTGPALWAGGTFTLAGTTSANRIARWRNGAWEDVDRGVSGGTLPFVQAFAVFDDGSGPSIYIGGGFTSAGSAPAKSIARWDGTSWASVGGGIDVGSVDAFAIFDDGTGPALYVGGGITLVGGSPVGNIVRWDGTSWSSPAFGVQAGSVHALATFDDGQGPALYAGGDFTSASGVPALRIARWDGTSWSSVGGGVSSTVNALFVHDDGSGEKLYAGGAFAQAGGQTVNGVATWDGAAWAPLGASLPPFAQVYDLFAFDDGQGVALYAGGPSASGQVARWNGASWTFLASQINNTVRALAGFDEGAGAKLFAGGEFTASGTTALGRIAGHDGSAWKPLGDPAISQGANNGVLALAEFDDGSGPALYASGSYSAIGGLVATSARWDGATWSALPNLGTSDALAVLDLGGGPSLYAGAFNSVRRWDGAAWIGVGGQMDGAVHALAQFDPGTGETVYAGGSFHTAGGVLVNAITRWTGTAWAPLGTGVGGDVLALATFDSGSGARLYAGGTFSTTPSNYVAAWNGTVWASVGGGTNGQVFALRVFDDGSGLALYAAGAFTTAGGVAARNVARWNGSAWSAVGTGLDAIVHALTVFDDGSGPALYAGGSFNVSPTCPAARIARWNGTTWSGLGSGTNGSVRALASFDDGKGPSLFVGGTFQHAGLAGSSNIAQWRGCSGPIELFCFGDGSLRPCPCANEGVYQHGCENSASTGGARLFASGTTSPDTLFLQASGELPSALSIFLQGDEVLTSGVSFGDGVRCAAGNLVRLFVKNASTGVVSAPQAGDPSIGQQSAALGDPISAGSTRWYQVYYRDPSMTFCPPPQGDGWNVTNGARVVW